jgi:hypothetical protein
MAKRSVQVGDGGLPQPPKPRKPKKPRKMTKKQIKAITRGIKMRWTPTNQSEADLISNL